MDQPGKEWLKDSVKHPCIKGAKYIIEYSQQNSIGQSKDWHRDSEGTKGVENGLPPVAGR